MTPEDKEFVQRTVIIVTCVIIALLITLFDEGIFG